MTPEDIKQFEPLLLKLAAQSPCSRDKRGAIVVRDGKMLGGGYNAPVGGACTDAVCRKVVRREGWAEPVARSCGGHVEHAEAMAMRCGQISLALAHDFDEFDLAGCDLIHLNTDLVSAVLGVDEKALMANVQGWLADNSVEVG